MEVRINGLSSLPITPYKVEALKSCQREISSQRGLYPRILKEILNSYS